MNVAGQTLLHSRFISFFVPAEGDQPDGIQLWSTQQEEPGRNITLRDNLVAKGGGGHAQGIFIRDTFRQLPFENIGISGNISRPPAPEPDGGAIGAVSWRTRLTCQAR